MVCYSRGSSFCSRFVRGVLCGAHRRPTRRCVSHNVYPCSGRLDGYVPLRVDGDLRWSRLGVQRASLVDDGDLDIRYGRVVHISVADNGCILGKTNVGHLVGLGCSHDFDAYPSFSLRRFYLVASFD